MFLQWDLLYIAEVLQHRSGIAKHTCAYLPTITTIQVHQLCLLQDFNPGVPLFGLFLFGLVVVGTSLVGLASLAFVQPTQCATQDFFGRRGVDIHLESA